MIFFIYRNICCFFLIINSLYVIAGDINNSTALFLKYYSITSSFHFQKQTNKHSSFSFALSHSLFTVDYNKDEMLYPRVAPFVSRLAPVWCICCMPPLYCICGWNCCWWYCAAAAAWWWYWCAACWCPWCCWWWWTWCDCCLINLRINGLVEWIQREKMGYWLFYSYPGLMAPRRTLESNLCASRDSSSSSPVPDFCDMGDWEPPVDLS